MDEVIKSLINNAVLDVLNSPEFNKALEAKVEKVILWKINEAPDIIANKIEERVKKAVESIQWPLRWPFNKN